jgi:hypothetical protein
VFVYFSLLYSFFFFFLAASTTCGSTLIADSGTCQYTCNNGFTLQGQSTTCPHGILSSQSCAKNCVVTSPTYGSLNTCSSSIVHGTNCQLSCNTNYVLTGSATSCNNGVVTYQTCVASTVSTTLLSVGSFYWPGNDKNGNIYCPRYTGTGAGLIDKIQTIPSQVITLGWASGFSNPIGAAVDSSGFVYISEWTQNRVSKISSSGGSLPNTAYATSKKNFLKIINNNIENK